MTATPEYCNSILIPATLMLLFYLLFVSCLAHCKTKGKILVLCLNAFCCETHSCAFCESRQATFLIPVRHKPFRRKKECPVIQEMLPATSVSYWKNWINSFHGIFTETFLFFSKKTVLDFSYKDHLGVLLPHPPHTSGNLYLISSLQRCN